MFPPVSFWPTSSHTGSLNTPRWGRDKFYYTASSPSKRKQFYSQFSTFVRTITIVIVIVPRPLAPLTMNNIHVYFRKFNEKKLQLFVVSNAWNNNIS
jgi:hypothetical protein